MKMKNTIHLVWAFVCLIQWQGFSQSFVSSKLIEGNPYSAENQDNVRTLKEALGDLEKRYSVSFLCRDEIAQKKVKFTPANNRDLQKELSRLLRPHQLDYKQVKEGFYVIFTEKASKESIQKREAMPIQRQKGKAKMGAKLKGKGVVQLPFYMQQTVSGTVTDEEGEPLPGVSIIIKGTSNGTTTDITGRYSLSVPSDAILQFSYIGFQDTEIAVGNQTTISVQMAPDLETLEEVVVVGYGTQEKRDLTGAISSVSSEQISRMPVPSLDNALQGQAPGVLINPNSGQPGGAVDVNIRGIGTFGNNSPLFVIDGVPVFNSINQGVGGIQTNPLSSIDPSNIESIEILKDASAAAIYGARAANGVIIITTKRGAEGAPKVTLNSYYGTQWFGGYIDMMNSEQFATLANEADRNGGRDPQPAFANPSSIQTNTDWQDEFFNPAPIQDHNITISGGTAKAQYMVSGGYFGQIGLAPSNGFERYSLRLNTDFQVTERIKIGQSLSLSRGHWWGGLPQGNDRLLELLQSSPTLPVYDEDNLGGFAGPTADVAGRVTRANQIAEAVLNQVDNYQNRVLGNIYAEVDIIEGLSYRLNMGLDALFNEGKSFNPVFEAGARSNPIANLSQTRSNENIYLLEHTLNYTKSLEGGHEFSVLAGYSQQNSVREFLNGGIQEFPTNDLRQINAGTGSSNISGDMSEWAIRSWLARVNYSFRDKYLLTANFRRDGSSRFGENNPWGNFPSISAGWRISEEAFMEGVDAVSDLKLRASWGQVGNQEIANYAYIATIDPVSRYILGVQQEVAAGAAILSAGNPDLKWETTTQTDIGIELGLLQNRFLFVADYYVKNTTDALLRLPIPVTTGIRRNNGSFVNAGEIRNSGLEFSLTYRKSTGDFTYNISGNLSTLTNEVISLGGGAPIFVNGTADNATVTTITEEGGEVGMFYGWLTDGVFQNQQEVDAHATQAPQTAPGDIRFRDLNGDGIINADDRTVIGSALPDFFYGLNGDFGYKGFDLSIFLQGVHGNELFSLFQGGLTSLTGLNNNTAEMVNRWTGAGTSNSIPRAVADDPNDNDRASDRYVESGSFIRLRNVSLGYTLPSSVSENIGVSNLRLYVTAQNLFTISDYSGYNPDIGVPLGPGSSNRTLFRGVDYATYPVSKSFIGGVQINF